MYKEIMEVLKCPHCGRGFTLKAEEVEGEEIVTGEIFCENQHVFPIRFGVLDFGAKEQEGANTWSEYYQEQDYEALDQEIHDRKSPKQQEQEEIFLDGIIKEVQSLERGFLLDVASGRGLLLKKLQTKLSNEVHVISTDLSFSVLMYDRIKFKKLESKLKVSYVACDATKLPIKDESIDMACTMAGFVNMLTIMEEGLKDCARVLRPGSSLIDSLVYVKEGTAGYENVVKVMEENDLAGCEKIPLQIYQQELHKKYFINIEEKMYNEGIAESEEGDLLPIGGEWFADCVMKCQK